jgi:hypothetical protein
VKNKFTDLVKILLPYHNLSYRNKNSQTVFDMTNNEEILSFLRGSEDENRKVRNKESYKKKETVIIH